MTKKENANRKKFICDLCRRTCSNTSSARRCGEWIDDVPCKGKIIELKP